MYVHVFMGMRVLLPSLVLLSTAFGVVVYVRMYMLRMFANCNGCCVHTCL